MRSCSATARVTSHRRCWRDPTVHSVARWVTSMATVSIPYDIFVANSGQHNEYLWYDPCSDDGYFYDSFTDGCYACPRYTTDTRHSMALCEAGTIGPGQSSEARPAVFLRSLRSGQDSCAGRFASSGAPSCEPCPAPLVTNAEGDGATACITLDLMHEMRSRHGRVTRTMGTRRTRRASRVRRARRASKR
jgi:hypothetical protein